MQRPYKGIWLLLSAVLIALLISPSVFGQETSAGIQGTVKDPTGALVAKAKIEVASPALIGTKKAESDSAGYYRFANLPPGTYSLTVTMTGFRTSRQEGIELATGHLPSIDVRLEVGSLTETVEVSSQAAMIDSTQSKVQTNISSASIQNLPTQSNSFQSVIQFAPGARYEPLQSDSTGANNYANNGFQINGASNSENSYLVDGQETASIFDGRSQANIPMEFIDEVQVKTSGFEAEYGGALGGVVNVISKRGSNDWHGSVFMSLFDNRFNAALSPTQLSNPQFPQNANGAPRLDQPMEYYYPIKDHRRIVDPGFTLGGALIKDRLWIFAGTSPDFDNLRRVVVSAYPGAVGPRTYNDNIYTYYSFARVDFRATEKIRLYGSWNYGYSRNTGATLPAYADEVHGQYNPSSTSNPDNYNGGIGFVYPQVIYNVGADVTVTPSVIATTRFGYFYYDTQSRGVPTGIRYIYRNTNYSYSTTNAPALAGTMALDGTVLPSQFVNATGYSNIGANAQTAFDQWKKYSFSQDLAYFKNFLGTHNLKFGYGFNHGLANELQNVFDTADVYVGYNVQYRPQTTNGQGRCAAIVAQNLTQYGAAGGNATGTACQGLWGTVNLRDNIGAAGKVGNWNHAFYVQDNWTVAKGLTLNLGLRLDKENLPTYNSLPGFKGISFGWGQKIAPRLGAAYDVLHNGKLKVYGSWGYFYDIMKFQLPQGSFGGAYWHDCVYALDSPNYNLIVPQRDAQGHYCPVGTGATPANGSFPAMRFIENYDYREPSNDPNQVGSLGPTGLVDPNLKPMKQHVMTAGAALELKHDMVFEPVYTRSRLDRTIEDAGTITQNGEVYYIVNPGMGVNATVPNCNGCPKNIKAIRNYDGLELRLTKRFSHDWFGAFSYTYSRLYGNYDGLTSTDLSDGVGRNGANTDRAFDEPFMSFDAHGKAINGPLGTDRPHTFKANVYYNLKWWKFNTVFGLFEQAYSGTPVSSYISVWGAPVFVEGRGNFVQMSRDPSTGNWIQGAVSAMRTPRFVQSDLSAYQDFKVSKTNEKLVARIGAECVNCLNQHHPTVITSNLVVSGGITPATCGTAGTNCTQIGADQAGFDYGALMSKGYDYTAGANAAKSTLSNLYGSPQAWQRPRTMRFQVKFTF